MCKTIDGKTYARNRTGEWIRAGIMVYCPTCKNIIPHSVNFENGFESCKVLREKRGKDAILGYGLLLLRGCSDYNPFESDDYYTEVA